jgi:hypothetical protein
MGQRARRAKHQAIQAKKDGKEYSSINWKEMKTQDDARAASLVSRTTPTPSPQVTMLVLLPILAIRILQQPHPNNKRTEKKRKRPVPITLGLSKNPRRTLLWSVREPRLPANKIYDCLALFGTRFMDG